MAAPSPAPAPRKLRLPIACTIITGGLGAGKTTALRHLVARKPTSEVWAIVVNEFGKCGIDGAAIESATAGGDGGVAIRQIAGGCLCCVTAGLLTPAIAQILRQVKPDRWVARVFVPFEFRRDGVCAEVLTRLRRGVDSAPRYPQQHPTPSLLVTTHDDTQSTTGCSLNPAGSATRGGW